MLGDPQDTIVALSTAPGPGARAIVRLSGQTALVVASSVFQSTLAGSSKRHFRTGQVRLPGVHSPLPAELYFWPAPHSLTGQEVVELHTLSSPPLIEMLIAECLNAGARAALPGEFTMRAFLAGKLDLTKAEAICGVIESGSRDELKLALAQLAGGISRPLVELCDDMLNLLADIEAGLDFTDQDIHFIDQRELLTRLAKALAHVTMLRRQLDQRTIAGKTFRVVLVGRPNAGKSSLFNALGGSAAALVSSQPGTTRDYLVARVEFCGVQVELMDTAGVRPVGGPKGAGYSGNGIERQGEALGQEQASHAGLVLLCVEASRWTPEEDSHVGRSGLHVETVATKCDLAVSPEGWHATSVVTQEGIQELRECVADRARTHALPGLAPSLSRCRHHVEAALEHLRRAHSIALHHDPAELLAVELRGALDELGAMAGAVYTDDLLDRIFSRFCIGK